MFFIFGFGRQTFKHYGKTEERICGHCHKKAPRILVRITNWFSIFFIPLIPYGAKYVLLCPLCRDAQEVSGEDLQDVLNGLKPMDDGDEVNPATPDESDGDQAGWLERGDEEFKKLMGKQDKNRYAGKTPTQIAYLEKMEAYEKTLEEEVDAGPEDAPAPDGPRWAAGGEDPEERTRSLMIKEKELDARAKALDAREKALDAREKALGTKEAGIKRP